MRRVSASAVIGAPVERVWELYADLARTPEWVPFVEEVLEVSGPLEVGMTYRERTRLGGVTGVQAWTIVELEPMRRRVETSNDLHMASTLVFTFQPRGARTRVRQESVVRSDLPHPLAWAHELVVGAVATMAMRAAIAGAKQRLESG